VNLAAEKSFFLVVFAGIYRERLWPWGLLRTGTKSVLLDWDESKTGMLFLD